MRVALIHYWLVSMRGGERVLEALCEMYPDAEIFTHVYDPSAICETIRRHKIHTTFIQRLPRATRWYQRYIAAMPMALEQIDLRGFDLVISIESGPAKGVISPPEALHICYCCTPMRYLWDLYGLYLRGASPIIRLAFRPLAHYLRLWDVVSSTRVDEFVSISSHVAKRIQKYYRRDSTVIPAPVDYERFVQHAPPGDSYLFLGQLVRYKRADLAVAACTQLGRKLVVLGDGEEAPALRRIAGPSVTFLGRQPDSVVREQVARCRALLFPGEEDFGIVPLEAMAAGRPVIAYGRGGVLDTVLPGTTGVFFPEQSASSLAEAIQSFEANEESFDATAIQDHVSQFDRRLFKVRMSRLITALLAGARPATSPSTSLAIGTTNTVVAEVQRPPLQSNPPTQASN